MLSRKAKLGAAIGAALAGAATGVIAGFLIGPTLIHPTTTASIVLPPSQGAPSSSVATPPPGAWVDAGGRRTWASFGSFCWERSCVKAKPDTPGHPIVLLEVVPGAQMHLHFAFVPTATTVSEGTTTTKAAASETITLPLSQPGVISVRAQAKQGWVSYLVRIRFTRRG